MNTNNFLSGKDVVGPDSTCDPVHIELEFNKLNYLGKILQKIRIDWQFDTMYTTVCRYQNLLVMVLQN